MSQAYAWRRIGAAIGLAALAAMLASQPAAARAWKYTCSDRFLATNPTTHRVTEGGTFSATATTQAAAVRKLAQICKAHNYQNCVLVSCQPG